MTIEDPFPPVDPIVGPSGTPPVVPRRRRFGQKSRELYRELNQLNKELREEGSAVQSPPDPPPGEERFDRRV